MTPSDCYLVRHAESQPDPQIAEDDWPLSPTGLEQARALGDDLLAHGVEQVYSTLARAPRVAAPIITSQLTLSMQVDGYRMGSGQVC